MELEDDFGFFACFAMDLQERELSWYTPPNDKPPRPCSRRTSVCEPRGVQRAITAIPFMGLIDASCKFTV